MKFAATKEHLFPKWLILKTNTHQTGIKWFGGKYISAMGATIPICKKCNNDFGVYLEGPVSQVFNDLENDSGMSEKEIELLIRWMWKIDGIGWILRNPLGKYSINGKTLKDRILNPIDRNICEKLLFAASLVKNIDPIYGDSPMGMDSKCEYDPYFVSGVFSKIAMLVTYKEFENMIPKQFSKFNLGFNQNKDSEIKLFFPKYGFDNDTDAVSITKSISVKLSNLHDENAKKILDKYGYKTNS